MVVSFMSSGLLNIRRDMLTICRSAGSKEHRDPQYAPAWLVRLTRDHTAFDKGGSGVAMLISSAYLTFCACHGADCPRAGPDVHDVWGLDPRDTEVRALAHCLLQHTPEPVKDDGALSTINCRNTLHRHTCLPASRLPNLLEPL